MANDNRKWYVVWNGTEPGVCDSWAECELRVKGFPGARYKAFNTQQEAVEAFRNDPGEMDLLRAIARGPREIVNYEAIPGIVIDSIAVDGACSGNPGIMEYRGVDVPTGVELFHQGPFPDATNNIGEFLAPMCACLKSYSEPNNGSSLTRGLTRFSSGTPLNGERYRQISAANDSKRYGNEKSDEIS